MSIKASILISSYNRLELFERTLWAIAYRKPSCQFEVIVADECSTEDTLSILKKYNSIFPWKFITFDHELFTEETGLAKFHNSPCVTNNIAFKHSSGEVVFLQGNEVIAWGDVYDQLLADAPKCDNWMVMSTTYDLPADILSQVDKFGSNLHNNMVEHCHRWVLQSPEYRSDVTNYISLCPRTLWEQLDGYNEQYFAGISAEDSDFVRRARKLPEFQQVISQGVSLHQYHGGKTRYYNPRPDVIDKGKWDTGTQQNHAIFHSWDETHNNPQTWPWGEYGVTEIITNGY